MNSQASSQVWVCGEALIDLIPDVNGELSAIVGGGPANTAKAAANLGISTAFIAGLSSDEHGRLIENELSEYGVDLSLVNRSDLPTATASVSVDEEGSATYNFALAGTATFDFTHDWLPPGAPSVLYLGSLAAVLAPGASTLLQWAKGLDTQIIFDPNVRPTLIQERLKYWEVIKPWFEISKIVKLSDEDLDFLFGNEVTGTEKAVQLILDLGPELVVLTHGKGGISGFSGDYSTHQAAAEITVADTVGAGDTVGALLIEGLIAHGLEEMKNKALSEVLKRATRAAGITCSRVGAKPPKLAELL